MLCIYRLLTGNARVSSLQLPIKAGVAAKPALSVFILCTTLGFGNKQLL